MSDTINHPPHYQTESGLEAIDVIEAFDQHSYHISSALKYLLRAGKKGDAKEDVKKAIWFLERYISRAENIDTKEKKVYDSITWIPQHGAHQ